MRQIKDFVAQNVKNTVSDVSGHFFCPEMEFNRLHAISWQKQNPLIIGK